MNDNNGYLSDKRHQHDRDGMIPALVDAYVNERKVASQAAEIAALAARVAELEAVAAAADILAHDIPPGDNRKALDRWWGIRTYANCTVCHPPADGGSPE